jgi:hypothetical protein
MGAGTNSAGRAQFSGGSRLEVGGWIGARVRESTALRRRVTAVPPHGELLASALRRGGWIDAPRGPAERGSGLLTQSLRVRVLPARAGRDATGGRSRRAGGE